MKRWKKMFLVWTYEQIHENVQNSITTKKNLKILSLGKIEFQYTCKVKHPFLQFEVKNDCLNHLFM